jgi:hypothetical protein
MIDKGAPRACRCGIWPQTSSRRFIKPNGRLDGGYDVFGETPVVLGKKVAAVIVAP